MTSAAMLLATWPLINGRTGSDLIKADFKKKCYNQRSEYVSATYTYNLAVSTCKYDCKY